MIMDLDQMQLFEIKLERDAGASKIYQLYYGPFPTGVDLVVKRNTECLHVEMGFGVTYHSGGNIITRPFVMWTGNTTQEPYTMKLGSPRMGRECLNMGRTTTLAQLKVGVKEFLMSDEGSSIILSNFTKKMQLHRLELESTMLISSKLTEVLL